MTFFAGIDNKANDTSAAGDSNVFGLFCIFTKTLSCENAIKHAYEHSHKFCGSFGAGVPLKRISPLEEFIKLFTGSIKQCLLLPEIY